MAGTASPKTAASSAVSHADGHVPFERSRDIFPAVDGRAAIDLERPRSIPQLIGASFDLYFRVPILFLLLAAVVVVVGVGAVADHRRGAARTSARELLEAQLLTLPDYFLITPLVSGPPCPRGSRTGRRRATPPHAGHSLDPGVYTDEGRPPGWYVDPDKPWRMRYWRTGKETGWSKKTTKTPKQVLDEWRDLRWRR
jgi:hypothetical protein